MPQDSSVCSTSNLLRQIRMREQKIETFQCWDDVGVFASSRIWIIMRNKEWHWCTIINIQILDNWKTNTGPDFILAWLVINRWDRSVQISHWRDNCTDRYDAQYNGIIIGMPYNFSIFNPSWQYGFQYRHVNSYMCWSQSSPKDQHHFGMIIWDHTTFRSRYRNLFLRKSRQSALPLFSAWYKWYLWFIAFNTFHLVGNQNLV